MIKLKSKFPLIELSSLLLSLLIISINLREPFFHTREILFVLTILVSFKLMDINRMKYTIYLIVIWIITTLYNTVVPGSNIDFGNGGFETIIISAYLLLMCFYQERYSKVIIQSYNFASILVAFIIITIWVACYFSSSLYDTLRTFFLNLEESTGLSLIAIDRRAILGVRFLAVWYRTAPCMACTLGYYLAQRLNGKKRNLIKIVMLFIALLFSATRANIVAAFILFSFYIGFYLYKKGFRFTPIILFATIMTVAITVLINFLNDTDSQSSTIKVLDALTYLEIFKKDPIRTVFFGYGVGSSFYSLGRQMLVNVTENSLFETIRRYGLVSTIVIFYGIWFTPFKSTNFIKRENFTKYYYYSIYGAYMLSALSNPYLLDSVGFCALLYLCIIFSYGTDIHVDRQEVKFLIKQ